MSGLTIARLTCYSVVAFILSLVLAGCPFSFKDVTPSAIATTINGVPLIAVEPELQNPWTQELEAEFQQRAATVIDYFADPKGYGSSYGENEKNSYPRAMFDFLAGNRDKALAFLQAEDPQADKHQHTEGIDYYYCFTLKGQIRKYFLFGQFLDPAYKQRMYAGAKKWTEEDPNGRSHPIYGYGDGKGKAWDMNKRGGWVDNRNTDNLRAMREVAVYLLAEETGNEKTRQRYKEKLQRYVRSLYRVGMGEWDSEAYMSHTFAPYLNLYDFAKDREVKELAKSALDWMSAAAAVKYYRGGWGGPSKRDYGGGNLALSASAAKAFWLYFGDTPLRTLQPELDTLHIITSTYRPPQAVVALARKQFDKPVELLATKPIYENWKPGNDDYPAYWETQYFGHSYQMGSVAGTFPAYDVSPFKLMAYNSQRGVDYFVANTGGGWVQSGKREGDRIGQYGNLLIWLRPVTKTSFYFQLPKTAKAEIENGIWFFQLEKTWLAIRPINLKDYSAIEIRDRKYAPIYTNERTFRSDIKQGNYAGFALEVGEQETHGTYQEFKRSLKQKGKLDLAQIDRGRVTLQASLGDRLQLYCSDRDLLPALIGNGKERQWWNSFDLYQSQTRDRNPISLGWKQGKLSVKAGDLSFQTEI